MFKCVLGHQTVRYVKDFASYWLLCAEGLLYPRQPTTSAHHPQLERFFISDNHLRFEFVADGQCIYMWPVRLN